MNDFQENIIPALGQNDANVFLYENENSLIRILFVGNSISKHAPKPSVGWHNDCGMAASCTENDYVHLIMKRIIEKYDHNASFGIAQAAKYARTFFDKTPEDDYSLARKFNADIVLIFYGANVPKDYDSMEAPPKTFERAYRDMRNYLSRDGEAVVLHSMGFYIRPKLEEEKLVSIKEYNDTYIDIDDIRRLPESHGMFNHPGDLGMQMIADRFLEYLEPEIEKILAKKFEISQVKKAPHHD